MSQHEYLDVVAFIEDHKGKKHPKTIGFAYKRDQSSMTLKIELMPTHGWDGSCVIQRRKSRDDRSSNSNNRRDDDDGWGSRS